MANVQTAKLKEIYNKNGFRLYLLGNLFFLEAIIKNGDNMPYGYYKTERKAKNDLKKNLKLSNLVF